MATMEVNTYSDDGTHLKATCLLESVEHMHASSRMFGKDMSSVFQWKARMETAGFVNVREEVFKVYAAIAVRHNGLLIARIASPESVAQGFQTQGTRQIPPA